MKKTPDLKGKGPDQGAGQTARESGQLSAGAKQSVTGSNEVGVYSSGPMPVHGQEGRMARHGKS